PIWNAPFLHPYGTGFQTAFDLAQAPGPEPQSGIRARPAQHAAALAPGAAGVADPAGSGREWTSTCDGGTTPDAAGRVLGTPDLRAVPILEGCQRSRMGVRRCPALRPRPALRLA